MGHAVKNGTSSSRPYSLVHPYSESIQVLKFMHNIEGIVSSISTYIQVSTSWTKYTAQCEILYLSQPLQHGELTSKYNMA
jgi:hypothetical protein